jgi:hypothetical protein
MQARNLPELVTIAARLGFDNLTKAMVPLSSA